MGRRNGGLDIVVRGLRDGADHGKRRRTPDFDSFTALSRDRAATDVVPMFACKELFDFIKHLDQRHLFTSGSNLIGKR
jgi:hypothetical protein